MFLGNGIIYAVINQGKDYVLLNLIHVFIKPKSQIRLQPRPNSKIIIRLNITQQKSKVSAKKRAIETMINISKTQYFPICGFLKSKDSQPSTVYTQNHTSRYLLINFLIISCLYWKD